MLLFMTRSLADIGPALRKEIERIRQEFRRTGQPVPSVKWLVQTSIMRGLELVKSELKVKKET